MKDELNYELLADVAQVIMGQSPPSSTYNTVGKGLPFYQGKTDFGDMYPTPRVYCTEPSRIAEAGDILISVRAPVGPANVSQERSCIGRGISAIRVGKKLDRDFLLYFLRFYEPELAKAGTGSTFTAIAREDLETIKLPLPPLTEQKRIASLLARADRLRQLRRTAHDLSDALLQSVFLEMFGEPSVNDKGWDVVKLSEAFAIKPQIGTPNPAHNGGKYLVVRVGEIGSKKVDLESSQRITLDGKELERFRLKTGDFLLARAIGSEDHLGKASILQDVNEVVVFDSHVMRLRFNPKIMSPVFFWHWLKSDGGRARFMQRAGRTAVQFNVNTEQIADINIPLPPLSLQEEFAGMVTRVESLRGRMGESTRQVDGLFESLLAESFG